MAKKRRGRPRKTQQVTYDSKETKFALGIIFFAFAVIGFISYFVIEPNSIFSFVRSLFGDATFFLASFSASLALALFGVNAFFTARKSIVAQFLLAVSLSVLMVALADPLTAKTLSYTGAVGGVIGYELAIFSLTSFFLNLTAPAALVLCVLLLPSVFNQSVPDFFASVAQQVQMLWGGVPQEAQAPVTPDVLQPQPMQVPARPATIGGFRDLNRQENRPAAPENKPKLVQNPNAGSAPEFVGLGGATVRNESQSAANGEEPQLLYPNWKLPPLDLLDPAVKVQMEEEDVRNNETIIEQTLASFGIEAKVARTIVGPSVTQYALDIALGIKVSKISNLRNDLALALATASNAVRIEAPIPDTSFIGIEIPNSKRRPVFFRELVEDKQMRDPKYMLPVSVGKDITDRGIVADIQKMPHLLVAGATGSGKSVLTNSFILSLLMLKTPDQVKFILVDPKQVELSDYNGIPHLLTPVIVDSSKVISALKWSVAEMERRYTTFREAQVKNIEGYNQKMGFTAIPYIVIVIDEMADMMLTAGRADLETAIVRLAQKARATGIHLILATQRPSVNVITGLIKANVPGRIGMSVTTQIDSRVILDTIGAESLLGKGDMLFKEPDKNKPYRVQGVFVSQPEVQRVVDFIKGQTTELHYDESILASSEAPEAGANGEATTVSGDDMFADAVRVIVSAQKGSASLIQRKLSLGYNRAAKLLDQMEELGIVGPPNGAKPRDVLVTDAEAFLQSLQPQAPQ